MNGIVYNPAETEPDIRCLTTETTASEDIYSTTPLRAMRSNYRQSNEDELHSAFEVAISDRVFALNRQLRRLSVSLVDNVAVQSAIYPHVGQPAKATHFTLLRPGFREVLLLITIACMLIMVGFDVMGLLILLKF